ncbi:MAG: hypothetical protein HGGPFJEG_02022 [Ignavibacteria bacterium]|nr:hypothetical protein [Ignavibacteria bacterium]
MQKIKFIISFILVLVFNLNVISQESNQYKKLEIKEKLINQDSKVNSVGNLNLESPSKKKGEKSPYLGALFSGIIPGTGEFYAESFIKAGIFFAIEAGLWTAYFVYDNKGDDQTDYYQNFANENWDVYKYAGWLKDENFQGSEGIDLSANKDVLRHQVNYCESLNFSHQLPPYGDQQYYELIGKYQNFVPGWADADLSVVNRNNYGSYKTNMFTSYSYDRQQANDYYNKRSTASTLIIVNHLLSAADAAWSVSMFNKELKVETGVHLENAYSYDGEKFTIPVANMKVTF